METALTTDSDRLARIERQQTAIIEAINAQTDAVNATNVMVAKIHDMLSEPPSSDLGEVIARIAVQVGEIHAMVGALYKATYTQQS